MTYRDDEDALDARAAGLEEEIRALDARRAELAGVEAGREAIEAALVENDGRLVPLRKKATPALRARVRIASPCSERWATMRGTDRVRHCDRCRQDVYDLSALTTDEAEALIAKNLGRAEGERLCVTFYRRSDGTILTRDCEPGRWRLRLEAAVIGALVALAAFAGWRHFRPGPRTTVRYAGSLVDSLPTDDASATALPAEPPASQAR